MLDWIQERPIPKIDRTNKSLRSKRDLRGGGYQSSLTGLKRTVTRKSLPNLSSAHTTQQEDIKSLNDNKNNKQSTLEDHFCGSNETPSTDKGDVEMSFASRLNANGGPQHSSLFESFHSHFSSQTTRKLTGKRRKTDTTDGRSGKTSEPDREPVKRRRTSQSSFESIDSAVDEVTKVYDQPQNDNIEPSSAAATDETQPLAWSSDEEQNLKPKQQSPTPRRKVKLKRNAKSAFAPAISPSKRKTLIEQSAKDYAIQQARRNLRGALSPIENQCDTRRNSSLDPSIHQSISHLCDKTPSPLRKGFSVIQLVEDDYFSQDTHYSDEEDDLDMLGGPTSPLMSCKLPFQKGHGIESQSSPPKAKQRIYAYETQALPNVTEGLGIVAEEDSQKANKEQGKNVREKEAEAGNDIDSSQTAPGGSWPGQTEHAIKPAEQEESLRMSRKSSLDQSKEPQKECSPPFQYGETYVSDSSDDVCDNVIDETFRMPSSQNIADYDLTVTKRTLRSASNKRESDGASDFKTNIFDASSSLTDAETQPLPWEDYLADQSHHKDKPEQDSHKKALQNGKKQGTPRYSAGWNDLSQVWNGHLDLKNNSASKKKKKRHQQSSLNSFGFSRSAKNTQETDTQQGLMSDPENVDSDDDLNPLSATNNDNDALPISPQGTSQSHNRLQLYVEGEYPLPSNGKSSDFSAQQTRSANVAGSSSQSALSIPSDSGLDSQIQNFLSEL